MDFFFSFFFADHLEEVEILPVIMAESDERTEVVNNPDDNPTTESDDHDTEVVNNPDDNPPTESGDHDIPITHQILSEIQ
jgi:hypothetical protein